LFTPIWLTAVACYVAGPLKVRLSFRSQNVPLHLLNPSTNTDIYVHTSKLRIFLSWLIWFWHCLLRLSLALEFTVGWNINTGLWSKKLFFTKKVVSGISYPYNSDKSNAQKSEISRKLNVYSYRRAHRHASCSAGV